MNCKKVDNNVTAPKSKLKSTQKKGMIKGKTPSLKKVPGKKKVEIVKLTKVSEIYTVVYQINTSACLYGDVESEIREKR